jgi:hypothetical protein
VVAIAHPSKPAGDFELRALGDTVGPWLERTVVPIDRPLLAAFVAPPTCDVCKGAGVSTCAKCSGKGEIECQECSGVGSITVECDGCPHLHEHDCQDCEDGRTECDCSEGKDACACVYDPQPARMFGALFDKRFVALALAELPEGLLSAGAPPSDLEPLVLRAGGVVAVIMPMRDDMCDANAPVFEAGETAARGTGT